MDLESFVRGFFLGFSIAAPVGPIGVLCIKRSLSGGWHHGISSGLGAASADALYGLMAATGLTIVSETLVGCSAGLHIAGGLFLCYLGIRTFLSRPSGSASDPERAGIIGGFISTFFLTLTNPLTILSFSAMFAGIGLSAKTTEAMPLVGGVWSGSAAWWLILCGSVAVFRHRLNSSSLVWINRLSGALILCFGVAAITS